LVHKIFFSALVVCLSLAVNVAGDTPFDFTVYGNFKKMVRTGDASRKVAVLSVSDSDGIYGVGAIAELRGEILVWDGNIFVTPGESDTGSTRPATSDDQATLIVTARVKEWIEVQIVHDMTQPEFEQFVIDNASATQININRPFPFIVNGEVTDYTWHVITGRVKRHDGGAKHQKAKHGKGHATRRTFSGPKTTGKLIGFYSAEKFEGVISHPGERFHVHYADHDVKISGHLDRFGIGGGSILLLPKP
jgi:alpha-acetolactate decarboxylase